MPKKRSWTDEELHIAVNQSRSFRNVLILLRLVPAGGNHDQIKKRIKLLYISTSHFTGKVWNSGMRYETKTKPNLETLLITGSEIQSFKLKRRLFGAGLKSPSCELCGWAEVSVDGRIPVELDHVNGVHDDNRIENLRILCPNCHSLQLTHRGKNKKVKLRLQ